MSEQAKNSYAFLGVYAGKLATFRIGVSKSAHFGGATYSKTERESMGVKLTEEQRHTMRYEITMAFKLRADVDPAAARR